MRVLATLGVTAISLGGCGRLHFDVRGEAATYYVASSTPAHIATVDLATGEVDELGVVTPDFGTLGGLAYWDATTLYGTNGGQVVKITLPTLDAVLVQTLSVGGLTALERDGDQLLGVSETDNALVRFSPAGSPTVTPITDGVASVDANGGDLTHLPDGTLVWWSSGTNRLYAVNPVTAIATAIGTPDSTVPFVSGMVADDDGRVFVTSDTAEVVALDPVTAHVAARTMLCAPCPGTTYDLGRGDATRSR